MHPCTQKLNVLYYFIHANWMYYVLAWVKTEYASFRSRCSLRYDTWAYSQIIIWKICQNVLKVNHRMFRDTSSWWKCRLINRKWKLKNKINQNIHESICTLPDYSCTHHGHCSLSHSALHLEPVAKEQHKFNSKQPKSKPNEEGQR